MPIIVGGLRQRLNFDSIKNEIERALTSIGWFDGGRSHQALNFITGPVDDRTEVPLNTLVLAAENMNDTFIEIGSDYSEHRRTFFVDLYAESQSLGEHLIYDIRDILEGRMPSHGRSGPLIDVYDYQQATPPVIHTLELEFITVDRGHTFSFPWQKFWWSAMFTAVDCYGNEDDT